VAHLSELGVADIAPQKIKSSIKKDLSKIGTGLSSS
jgi:hypothetical protein